MHLLHKLQYGPLAGEVGDGVMFATYQSLIAKNKKSESRLEQVVEWAAAATGGDPTKVRTPHSCPTADELHSVNRTITTSRASVRWVPNL